MADRASAYPDGRAHLQSIDYECLLYGHSSSFGIFAGACRGSFHRLIKKRSALLLFTRPFVCASISVKSFLYLAQ